MRRILPTAVAVRVREEARYGRLPLLPEERDLGLRRALSAHLSIVMTFWPLLVGTFLPQNVRLLPSLWTLLAGTYFGATLSTMGSLAAGRYGIGAVDSVKCVFGQRGAKLFIFIFLASATVEIEALYNLTADLLRSVTFVFHLASPHLFPFLRLGFFLAIGALCAPGPLLVSRLSYLILPANSLILGLLALLGLQESIPTQPLDIELAPALAGTGSRAIYFWVGASLALKEWAHTTALIRDAATRSAAFVPMFTLFAPGLGVMAWLGSALVKMTGLTSTGVWLQMLGGPFFLVVSSSVAVGAILATASTQVTLTALSLRQFRAYRRLSWSQSICALSILAFFVGFFPITHKSVFLYSLLAIGLSLGTGLSIVCLNFYLLRRQRLDLCAVFDDDCRARYKFSFGFEWSSVALWICVAHLFALVTAFHHVSTISPVVLDSTVGVVILLLCSIYCWKRLKSPSLNEERNQQRPWTAFPRSLNL